jgi:ribosomal protein L44E
MMTEPKPLASLSSTLLARKGQAKPAMRPQGFAGFGMTAATAVHDDLGWNDMGVEHAVVHRQQEEIARELAPAKRNLVRAAPGSKGKAAFTLRLDPERHLQLRLVCAVQHRSAQQVVIAALDAFLSTQSDTANFAASKSASKR